jgi:hypothetical protein
MSELINLRQARKRKRRDDKARAAESNRLAHGRTKSEKERTKLSQELEAKRLEAHRRDRGHDTRR